ncbi:MAG: hypothetical protein ACK559_00460, partial [bacterium]
MAAGIQRQQRSCSAAGGWFESGSGGVFDGVGSADQPLLVRNRQRSSAWSAVSAAADFSGDRRRLSVRPDGSNPRGRFVAGSVSGAECVWDIICGGVVCRGAGTGQLASGATGQDSG